MGSLSRRGRITLAAAVLVTLVLTVGGVLAMPRLSPGQGMVVVALAAVGALTVCELLSMHRGR